MNKKGTKKRKYSYGDFSRIMPFSNNFGYDRGGPVDRYYIEKFLQNFAHLIKGDVLEIGDNLYTFKFGIDKVQKSEVLHIDPLSQNATIIGDLSNLPEVKDEVFDCIILTQTLHLIFNYKEALQTCFRVLKKGGVLLITVPGITSIDKGEWNKNWFWSFTPASLKLLLDEIFGINGHEDQSFGNSISAMAFLYGMGKQELDLVDLENYDPHYPVILSSCSMRLT